MSIYLVTNRSVKNDKIQENGKERALPTLRVAKCELDKGNKTVTYELIPDGQHTGYEAIEKVITGETEADDLTGTAHLFYNLYQNMVQDGDSPCDTLFFIHGFNYTLESSLSDIYRIHEIYAGENSPVKNIVFFSWPTVGHLFGTYWNDQEDAEETGKVLSRLFNKLFGFFLEMFEINGHVRCQNKIHLAAHSMGNQVLKYMLEGISSHKLFPLFQEVLLFNADVEWTVFEKGEAFTRLSLIAERTHMYIHRSDDALRISRFTKNFQQRLGFKGPKSREALDDETFIVDTTYGVKAQKFSEKHIDHWGYLHRLDVIEDVIKVFSGLDEDDFPGREKWEGSNKFFFFPDADK